jgi:hypothetical protein
MLDKKVRKKNKRRMETNYVTIGQLVLEWGKSVIHSGGQLLFLNNGR